MAEAKSIIYVDIETRGGKEAAAELENVKKSFGGLGEAAEETKSLDNALIAATEETKKLAAAAAAAAAEQQKSRAAILKAEKEAMSTLAFKIEKLDEYAEMEKRVAAATIKNKKEAAEKINEIDQSVINQKLQLQEDAYKAIVDSNGKITDSSIQSLDSLEKAIIETQKSVAAEMQKAQKGFGNNFVKAIKSVGSAFGGMKSAAAAAGAGMSKAFGAFGLAITAINQGIELVKKTFEGLLGLSNTNTGFSEDFEKAKKALDEILTVVGKIVGAFAAPAIKAFADGIDKVQGAFSDTSNIDKFAEAIGTVQAIIATIFDTVKDLLIQLYEGLAPAITAGIKWLAELDEKFNIVNITIGIVINTIQYLIDTISNGADIFTKLFSGDLKGAIEASKKLAVEAATGLVEVFTTAEATGEKFTKSFSEKQKTFTDQSKSFLKSTSTIAKDEAAGTLAFKIKKLDEYAEMEKRIAAATIKDEKKKADALKAIDQSVINQKLQLQKDAYKAIVDSNGKITDSSIQSLDSLEKAIIETQKSVAAEIGKNRDDINAATITNTNNILSVANDSLDIYRNLSKETSEDLAKYDAAITEAQNKLSTELEAFDAKRAADEEAKREKEKETENTDREERLVNLEEEYERSLEAGDQMSAKAIDIKIKELEKEKQAEDKKRAEDNKKKEEEAKLDEERKRIQAQGEYNIALAQYDRSVAEHNNNVAAAEQQKSRAIADTVLNTAEATANSFMVPLQPAWSSMGPFGMIAGAAAAATSLAAALSGISGISSATSALDSVKSTPPTPPTPPSFAYGTGGYSLKGGEYATVGEQGAEMVRQKPGGDLEVISTERTKSVTNENGNTVVNIIMNVKEMVEPTQFAKYISNLKSRSFAYALQ